jgi:GNAT superfamily N-acetyltransferase
VELRANRITENKLSDVLVRFAQPFLDHCQHFNQTKIIFDLAIMIWNISLDREKSDQEILDEAMTTLNDLAFADQTNIKGVLSGLIRRKRREFAADRRFVINYELTDGPDMVHLEVVHTDYDSNMRTMPPEGGLPERLSDPPDDGKPAQMTEPAMRAIVNAQLAIDLNCRPEDLSGAQDHILFTQARDNPGYRPFPPAERQFMMLSLGEAIVVSATPEILDTIKPQLIGRGRDEAFSMPFVNGLSLCFLPDLDQIRPLDPPDGYVYEQLGPADIPALYATEGFRNAVSYDPIHPRPDVLVLLARKDGQIVGMAGASRDCARMWQVGVDVLPGSRRCGLAAYLVNRLSLAILAEGIVPYYCTSTSNIASQRVAHRAGYAPAWVSSYRGRFEIKQNDRNEESPV